MKLDMRKADTFASLVHNRWDVGIVGVSLDDRGTAAIAEVRNATTSQIVMSYDPERFTVTFDSEAFHADDIGSHLTAFVGRKVILESTTLSFAELLLLCLAFRKIGIGQFDILYVEPETYRRPRRRQPFHRRDFELSDDVPGYRAIPGTGIFLRDRSPQKAVFFLGYEELRLQRAFEDLQMIQSPRATVAFGVPAYQAGWEMDAFANNIGVMREKNMLGGVYFCGADSPASVMELLSEIHASLQPGERLFVAPIGTKPHGIGVAVFVSHHNDVRVIYDHPRRASNRTEKVSSWHLYSVT